MAFQIEKRKETLVKNQYRLSPTIKYAIKKSLIALPLYLLASNTYSLNIDNQPPLLLAKNYKVSTLLEEFYVSEKLDGIRAFWNGENFYTRGGNIINAPAWFVNNLPDRAIDGELWIERGRFEDISALARRHSAIEQDWKKVKFMAFDLPYDLNPFVQRLSSLTRLIKESNIPHLQLVKQHEIKSKEDLDRYLSLVVAKGGEGVMLHRKNTLYQAKRSNDLQKLKPLYDSEATVLRYIEGKGKYQGYMGSMEVINDEGITFKIGSGFSFEERKNPPAIGSLITYQYRGKTNSNKPRFATFLREHSQN